MLQLSLLGPFRVILDGESVTGFATDKVRALLAFLAVEAARPHRRDALAGLLWPDQPQDRARQSLRQALSNLRQALGDRDRIPPLLQASRNAVQLNPPDDLELDVTAFTGLIADCRAHRHRRLETCLSCMRRLERAVALYQGSFLEGFFLGDSALFEEWSVLKREWLHRMVVEALSHLAVFYERRGEYGRARRYARQQVEFEPWREEAHQQLMRLLALAGQRSAALAQYESCRRALSKELGVEPTQETQRLYERIRAEKVLEAEPRHSLPPPPTPFVGRHEELTELADLLANPDCRLVTVVGPGGIGKTRLALQAAQEQVGAFAHGVHFVPCASISGAELLGPMIAHALGFSFHGPQDPDQQLLDFLQEKEILLLLDNMEHLLDGGELLAATLRRAPGVVLLVTSRERLNLREEWVYEIGGLAYPTDPAAPEWEEYDAVALFLQSARRVQHHFELSEPDRSLVVRICRMVEGMPLGLELAAAGVRVRTCKEIVREIAHNLDVLATSLRNVPERHRSLRAALEHSWNLLSEREQAAFCSLSVFRGGFYGEAAQSVAGASLTTLTDLVAKSLLRRNTSGRYEMHELLRQYAQDKLQAVSPQESELRDRHCAYFADFLHEREAWLQGGRQKEALEQIGVEIENVRAAWRRVIERQWEPQILRMVKGLSLFYELHSWYQEGIEALSLATERLLEPDSGTARRVPEASLEQVLVWRSRFLFHLGRYEEAQGPLQKSLARLRPREDRPEGAVGLYTLADVLVHTGEVERAERLARESYALARRLKDQHSAAQALSVWADVAARRGDYAETRERYREGLEICRKIQDLWGMAGFLSALGGVDGRLGDYAQARERFEEALTIFKEIGNRRGVAASLHNLSTLAYLDQDFKRARRLRRETLAICREIGYRWGVASSLKSLGDVARRLGEYREARISLQQGLTLFKDMGDRTGQALTLTSLGSVVKELGDHGESARYLRQALEAALEIQALPVALSALGGLAELSAEAGETERALEWLTFVLRHPASEKQTQDQMAQLQAELLPRLSPQAVQAAEERARSTTLEAVAEGLTAPGRN